MDRAGAVLIPPTLTRSAQVIDVLRAGGYVISRDTHATIYDLYNAACEIVPAWQQAITSSLSKLRITMSVTSAEGKATRWELPR